jgi:predicted RNA polymerase sigma factor
MTDAELVNYFTYHAPKGDQTERYQRIREAALVFARVVLANTTASADQTAAIRKLREAVMTANQGIACEP